MKDQQRQKTGLVVMQIIAIILFVIALISSSAYFVVRSSLKQAEEYNAVPTLMGKIYLPVTSDDFPEIAKNGSLVIGQPMTAENMSTGEVAIYALPTVSTDNMVYKSFGMGYIQSITEQDGDTVLNIQTDEGSVAVASTLIRGRAEQQVFLFGNFVKAVEQPMGLFSFVVVPVFLFVVLQLLVVIFRTLAGRSRRVDSDDEEYEEEYDGGLQLDNEEYEEESNDVEDSPQKQRRKEKKKKGFRFRLLEEVEDEDENEDEREQEDKDSTKESSSKPRKVTQIKSQTVSTIKGEYGLRNDKKDLLKPFLPSETEQPVVNVQPEATYVKPLVPPPQTVKSEFTHSNPSVRPMDQSTKPVEQPTQIFDAAFTDDEEYERRLMSEHTMEFDMAALKERMLKEEEQQQKTVSKEIPQIATQSNPVLEKPILEAKQSIEPSTSESNLAEETMQNAVDDLKQFDPQEILNKIMIEVKEERLDFDFQNLQEDGVKVEKNSSGDGFVISTSNYKANIKVELDKK